MQNNKIYLTIAGVLVVAVSVFFFFREEKIKTPPPKNDVIVAFGDSLVQGVGASEGNDFVSLIGKNIGRPIINKGKSGDTTASALTRLDEVVALDPGVVILLLGGNDYLRRVLKEETFENLKKITDAFKANGTIVLLLGVRGGLIRDTYESSFEDFAQAQRLHYVPNVLDGLIGNKEFMSDNIHPNDKGYKKMAERVTHELKKIIQ